MKRILAAGLAAALGLTILSASTGADDKAVLIELPSGVLADAVSSSGVVVGSLRPLGGIHWMPTSGDVFIGGVAATTVSRDGRTIAGNALDANRIQQAAIWQRGTEWRMLGSIVPNAAPCDNLLSSVFGGNADGSVLVGLAWNGCRIARAFRWEESTGMVDLGSTVEGQSSRADAVSGDGRVVVGFQEHSTGFRMAAKWIDGRQTLIAGPEPLLGEANATNADGSIIVGQYCRPATAGDQSAWIWTARDGVQCLPPPVRRIGSVDEFFGGLALATSDDGRVIGGAQSFGLDSESIVWIDREPFYLKNYLRDHGVPNAFEGWVNTGFINGMTRDGRVLVGYGAGRTNFTGFMVILPPLGERP
jgi:probable HAF family extracellular repeat protein